MILVDSTAPNALKVAERIRRLAEAMVIDHEGHQIRFTVSIGLSEFRKPVSSSMAWLEEADQALYMSKNSGRNRVSVWHHENEKQIGQLQG